MGTKTQNIGNLAVNKITANSIVGDIESIADLAERISALESYHPETKEKLIMGQVTCTAKDEDFLTFSWNAVEHAVKYAVSTNGGMTYAYTTDTTFTWTGLEHSKSYTIYVKAIGDNMQYASSDPVTCTAVTTNIVGETLAAPSGLGTSLVSKNKISFYWTAVPHASRYSISTDGENWQSNGTSTTFAMTGLDSLTEYTLHVKAIGDGIYYYDSSESSLSATTTDALVEELFEEQSLNNEWKFYLATLSSTEDFTSRASMLTKDYDDTSTSWSTVTVPHDWSISQAFSQSNTDYESGFLPGGDAIYRKHIMVDSDDLTKKHFLHFDGIYMVSEVFINGTSVGTNKNGYAPFEFDITDQLVAGDNVIAVTVSNRVPTSRYYSGSGIFRSAWIRKESFGTVSQPDITITTPNLATENGGNVTTNVSIKFHNTSSEDKELQFNISICQKWDDSVVGTGNATVNVDANSSGEATTAIQVSNPSLWQTHDLTNDIRMYYMKYSVVDGSDTYQCSINQDFGYRYVEYKSDGIYLNGSKLFMKGMSMHHDMGVIGAIMNKDAYKRQLEILKKAGINAIRCCHNPYAKEYMDMLAEMGFVSIEELFDGWHSPKNTNTYDYARFFSTNDEYKEYVIRNVIRRDKNNPSIIMWSIGNEVSEGATESRGSNYVAICQKLHDYCKLYDTTRGTTLGENMPTNSYAQQMMNIIDVIGINYGDDSEIQSVRTAYPSKCMYGSETTSPFYTRNYYVTDTGAYIYVSYDYTNTEMASSHAVWGDASCIALTRNRDTFNYIGGFFPWTGFDYIGEPTPSYAWPTRSSNFGIVDLLGFPKDAYYMYMAEYTSSPMVHICPMDWNNWTDGQNVAVWLYSNCATMKLYLNGTLVGTKTQSDKSSHLAFEFSVPFQKGVLIANAYNESNNLVAQDCLYTSLEAHHIQMKADKTMAKPGSILFVEASIVDKNGNLLPHSSEYITFNCVGGTIIGTDNGYTACIEAIANSFQTCFAGKCLVAIKPDGTSSDIQITASSISLSGTLSVLQGANNEYYSEPAKAFQDAEHPENVETLSISLSASTVQIDNGGSTIVTITRTPSISSTEIVIESSASVSASLENDVLTITAIQNDTTGAVTLTCGSIVETVNVEIGSGTLAEIEIVCDSTIYKYEYLAYSVNNAGTDYTIVSSNESVLEVNENTIYGVSAGTATITVTSHAGNTQSKQITVSAYPDVDFYSGAFRYDPADTLSSLEPNTSKTINIIYPIDSVTGNSPALIADIESDVAVSGSNVVEFGVNDDGTRKCYILKTSSSNPTNNEYSFSMDITIPENRKGYINYRIGKPIYKATIYKCGTLSCTGISLNYSSYTIDGDANNTGLQLVATVTPSNTTDDVVWTTSESICTCVEGNIVGLRNGSSTITATCGAYSATCSITIKNIYEDTTAVLKNHSSDGTAQTWYDGEWNSTYTMYFECIADASANTANIISFGNDLTGWNSGQHFHIYYPATSNTTTNDYTTSGTGICIAMTNGNGMGTMYVTNTLVGTGNNLIRIAMNSNGLYINGTNATSISVASGAFSSIYTLTTTTIGSKEGSSHFKGTVNELRIIKPANLKDGVSSIDATALLSLSTNGNVSDYIK